MDQLGESIRKLILAGIGAAAVTKEKSEGLLKELVKKGELTVEQGKVLNEELRHNVEKRVRESVTVQVTPQDGEELLRCVDAMTPEQLEALRRKLNQMDGAAQGGKENGDDEGADAGAAEQK